MTKCPYCDSQDITMQSVLKRDKPCKVLFIFLFLISAIGLLTAVIMFFSAAEDFTFTNLEMVLISSVLTSVSFLLIKIFGIMLIVTFVVRFLQPYRYSSEIIVICKSCSSIILHKEVNAKPKKQPKQSNKRNNASFL